MNKSEKTLWQEFKMLWKEFCHYYSADEIAKRMDGWAKRNAVYTLVCDQCEEEMFLGTREQIKQHEKDACVWIDWDDINEDDKIMYGNCGEFSCKMD